MAFLFVANLTLSLRISIIAALDLTVAEERGLWHLFGGRWWDRRGGGVIGVPAEEDLYGCARGGFAGVRARSSEQFLSF